MADTPSIPLPVDPKEQPILENLQLIRDELTLLKQDRTTYVKSTDVIVLYDKVVEQVKLLNDIRTEKPDRENRGSHSSLLLPYYMQLLTYLQWIEF